MAVALLDGVDHGTVGPRVTMDHILPALQFSYGMRGAAFNQTPAMQIKDDLLLAALVGMIVIGLITFGVVLAATP